MANNDAVHIRAALARSFADHKIADDVVDVVAKQLASAKHQVRGIDVCTHGICIDYFIDGHDWWKTLPELITIEGGILKGIEVFPWGIPYPDLFRVRVTQSMTGMPQLHG